MGHFKKSVFFWFLFAVFSAGSLYYIGFALATNGAFQNTKHGGGTVDGMPFGGVNRAANPDYGAYYNDQSTDAGQYQSGECSNCHEPHSSFGAIEPSPSAGSSADPGGGPNPYLGMADVGPEFCWYCHENLNYDPSYGGGTGFWKFYQGKAIYQGSSHYNSVNFYWPGTTGDPVAIWPRQNRSGISGNAGHCLNCHTPHGIKEASGQEFDTAAVPTSPTNLHLSANNASVSTDNLIPRQLIAWEEALCENCHDSNGPASSNIKDEINKRSSGGSGHPVDDTSLAGVHVASESIPLTTKHVECYDCHNPHAAKTGTNSPGDGDGGRIKGMKYVDINGNVRTPTSRQPYIYEICLKCHGNSFDCYMPYIANGASTMQAGCADGPFKHRGNESGTSYNDQRGASNKRLEFDPTTIYGTTHGADNTKANGAYHPVYQAGRNTSIQLCNQLQSAFGLDCSSQAAATTSLQNLTINCTDCHNNDATGLSNIRGPVTESSLRIKDKASVYAGGSPVGPHGSTNKRILRANYNTQISPGSAGWGGRGSSGAVAAMDSNFALCFLCHNSTPFKTDSNSTWTNFYATSGSWGGSLHNYHLSINMNDGIWIKCHECHTNVHSNVEANNAQYYSGGACCTGFPADGNTHLLNFAPNVTPDNYAKPAWYYSGSVFKCNLRCHGQTMSSCDYKGAYDGGPSGGGWC